MNPDMWALLWSFGYVGGIVVIGESAKRLGLSTEIARKIIHVGVGLWIFGTLALFTSPYMAIIPPLAAAAGNYVIHRKRLLKAVEAAPDNLGTVWFPISFAILILAFWNNAPAVAGGVMAMTIGDAVAATVGIRWGRHPYVTFDGRRKSLEGSVAMLLSTLAAVWVTMALLTPLALGAQHPEAAAAAGWRWAFAPAALAAVVGLCTEAAGIKGLDNLWVPLSAGVTIWGVSLLPPATAEALGVGALLAAAIGMAAWVKGSLSPTGVLGAILTGTLLFGLGGWPGGLALIGFFVSSSLLSRLFKGQKKAVEEEYAKGGTRDLGQALANGGAAAAAVVAFGLTGDFRWMGAVLGALAAANADTWATELGVLSRTQPRLLTSFRPVPAGTSGGVSATGTLAAAAGAAFVGAVAALGDASLWRLLPGVALAGLAGSLLDSLLGATVQGIQWCPACGKETERLVHRCGTATRLHRGLGWLNNDVVNFLATAAGGAVGFLAAGLI